MLKSIKKRFELKVTEPGKTVSQTFELDKTIKSVRGILLTSDKTDLLYYRGSQKIEINNEEYFSENYRSKWLMSDSSLPSRIRYYDIGVINPGNGSIKMTYQDREDSRTIFFQYRVLLCLDCEMETE